jgi:hypothetical protein
MTYRLMIKEHDDTHLKYLCITKRKEKWKEYTGSGVHWRNHLRAHGKKFQTTLVYETEDSEVFDTVCQFYSTLWDVADSNEWANLIPELGYVGNQGNLGEWSSRQTHELLSRQTIDSQPKRFATNIERYGHIVPSANTELRAQINQTCLEKYGATAAFNAPDKVDQYRAQAREIMLERYGVEHAFHIDKELNLDKRKDTCLEKYGVEYLLQIPENAQSVKEKREATLFAKYGVINVSNVPEIVAKRALSISKTAQNKPLIKCDWCDKESKVISKHMKNCKSNPDFIETRKVLTCEYCDIETFAPVNIRRWHNDNCKHKNNKDNK